MAFIREKLSEINFGILRNEFSFWVGLGLALFAVGKALDASTFEFIETYLRYPVLDRVMVFLTERFIWAILGVFAVVGAYRVWRSPEHKSRLMPALFAIFTAGVFAFLFKAIFDVPRPFLVLGVPPLVPEYSYAFPSAHTAVAFSILIPFWRIWRWLGLLWGLFAMAVGFARVYEILHWPSDIAGGIFLGGIIGSFYSHPEVQKMINILWKDLEFRRQSFHFVIGFLAVFFHWAGWLPLRYIALALVVGLGLSLYSQRRHIPIVSDLLRLFDRPRDRDFPGRGAFYFLLAVFLMFIIFNGKHLPIAYASILILSVGDSLNHLFTTGVQHLHLRWNRRRNVWGIVVGIVAGTVAAQFFVPWWAAFLASTFAILAETFPWKVGKYYIDDNLLVPAVAGLVLWVLV